MKLVFQVLSAIGGIGVIVIGLSKFLGDLWRDRRKEDARRNTELELAQTHQRLENRRVQADKYTETQFDVYRELWESLQGLHLTVDALWQRCSKQNLVALARQLERTKKSVGNWSLFFETVHLRELNRLFKILEHFHLGKVRLLELRSDSELRDWHLHEVEQQIQENYRYKDEFDAFLEKLRRSFKDRLSSLEPATQQPDDTS